MGKVIAHVLFIPFYILLAPMILISLIDEHICRLGDAWYVLCLFSELAWSGFLVYAIARLTIALSVKG